MEELPDSPSPAESLPDNGDGESLPGSDNGDMESLPDLLEDSDAEMVSLVMPVPGDAVQKERKDDLPSSCCVHNCLRVIETECAHQLREMLALKCKFSNDDFNEFLFNLLLTMRGVGIQTPKTSRMSLQLFGKKVCRKGFVECLGISQQRLTRLLRWLKEGHLHPPRDLRHSSAAERHNATTQCDVALQWAYDVLAETYNSSDVRPDDCDVDAPDVPDATEPSFLAMPTVDGFREWVHGPGATVTATGAQSGAVVKWLPPMPLCDLFESCKTQMQSLPSYITFFRCYNEHWRHRLKFRPKIMQSKCDDCERFKCLRRQAVTPEHNEAVKGQYLEHIQSTFHDRAVDERIQKAAYEAATTPGGVALARSILNMDIDAMEAMKFKCPRNIGAAKAMDGLWRPQQHMVGSIVDGCSDHYWLVPPDVVKNANLSVTLVADLLHHTLNHLQDKRVPLPKTFRVHSDNAGGEVKNQTFMEFMAWPTSTSTAQR